MNLTQEQIVERISILVGGADKKIDILTAELKDKIQKIKADSKEKLKADIAASRLETKELKKDVKSKCKIAVAKWTKLLNTLESDAEFQKQLNPEVDKAPEV